MPEIAEVRVVRDTLKKQIIGKQIKNIKVFYSGILENDEKTFKEKLLYKTFNNIRTNGKWLIFELQDIALLVHLRMEGKFFYVNSSKEIGKHEHIIFNLDNNMDLRFSDVRKFAKMQVVAINDVANLECISKLGLEPDNMQLNSDYLLDKFKNKSKNIKSILLDQTIINGLGNIYANEVLFASKINPKKKASMITKIEAEDIVKYAKKITDLSYKMGGCTIRSYTSSLGVIGNYQNELKVHGKEGRRCCICKNIIRREIIDGRSAFYCPYCQK